MSELTSRAATQDIVRSVLAADCACPVSAFMADGLLVTAAEERPGQRRYPPPSKPLFIATMGRGVVVTCHPERIAWLRTTLAGRERDEIFGAPTIAELSRYVARDGQTLGGPSVAFACARETFRPPADPDGISMSVVEGEDVFDLYQYPGFEYALSYQSDSDNSRPDVAAAAAYRAGEVVGIAGMSADSETMWQIGIEVSANECGAGLGRALVGRLTEVAFQHNRVPAYIAHVSNLRSQALAASLGYWPAWVHLFTQDAPDV
jgi:RimJ/RimL family protein N-acetyltransferase